jgi:D-arabinose 1-dehydrogenase-like Zn-dependent alcohol dehydrogenase
MINAVGAAARHSFSRFKRFEFQRADATANSCLPNGNGPMAPQEKATGGRNMYGKDNTVGGHSDARLVREEFMLKIPAGLPPEVAAPTLCAGVTTDSPMKHWGVEPELEG